MKKISLFIFITILTTFCFGQTIVFHENFELPSLGDSVVSTGNPGWHIGTYLHNTGSRSDSSKIANNDSTFLFTTTINTTGNFFVILQFSHICKIEFFDNAIIQVSNNNGVTWTQLTGTQYLGTGQFASNGNKFTSTSYTDWYPGIPSAIPNNSWWKTELFDISSMAANSSQVKIRFKLNDGNYNGANGNYGWLIDDIKVVMNFSEMIPPVISQQPPFYTGTVYYTGPFTVKAKITDASGIDTAKIVYTVNSGLPNFIGMTALSADTFKGIIPAVNNLDTVCFYLIAQDNSPNHNVTQFPALGCMTFVASSGIIFPYFENFDGFNNWTETSASNGTLWELGTPNYGLTNSSHSQPKAWDINLNNAYDTSAYAVLTSPVFDFSNSVNTKLSFWQNSNCSAGYDGVRLEYTTNGTIWHVLGTTNDINAVNWYTSNIIYSSNKPAWDGNSGGWIKSEFLLSNLNNTVGPVQFRFIFTSYMYPFWIGDGFSVDDFSISLPPEHEAKLIDIAHPESGCGLTNNETVSIKIKNTGLDTINGNLTASYRIMGSTSVITEPINNIILPDDTLIYSFSTTSNLSVTTNDSTFGMVSWITLTGDTVHSNDTIQKTVNSMHIPPAPTSSDTTVSYSTSATLTASASDSVFWYDVPVGGIPLLCSSIYMTPLLYDTTIYYAEVRPFANGIIYAGSGTLTNMQYTYPTPYGQFYNGARQQFLIQASELHAAGMNAGPIESLSFDVVTPISTGLINFNIKIGTTTQDSLTSWVSNGMLTVYSVPSYTTTTGWNEHVFTTPWTWDGVSNIVVETCFDNYPNGFTANAVVNQTTTTYISSLDFHSDLGNVCTTAPAAFVYSFSQRPNIKFKATSYGCPSSRIQVTVNITTPPALDASPVAFYKPVSGIDLTANEPVQIKIKNYGTTAISAFPVSYKINSNIPVTETVNVTINPGDTLVYTFSNNADLLAYGSYSFKAYTSLSGDTTNANDTVYRSVNNTKHTYCQSEALMSFDSDIGNVTISNINNGNPNPVLNNPSSINTYSDYTVSMPSVILLKGNSYPISISQINDYSYFNNAYIAVFIDYNRDGTFDFSTERAFGSQTSVIQTTVTGIVSVPITASIGNSRMRIVLQEYGDSATTLPCGSYYYGETEDYIVKIAPAIPNDAGVSFILNPSSQETEADFIPVKLIVKNYGTDTINSMSVDYYVNNGTPIIQSWTGILIPNQTDTFSLQGFTVPAGYNTICAYTILSGDSNTFNDKLCMPFYGLPLYDGGTTAIIQPGTLVTSGANIPVQVSVKNFGADTISSMNIVYKINNGTPVTQLWTGSLLSGGVINVTLPNFTVPPASFNIKAYTDVANDGNYSNDTVSKTSHGLFKDTLPYYDNFDGIIVKWFSQSTDSATKWEHGIPLYGVTNSAHSVPNAWDINLNNAYGENANAMLYTQQFDFSNAVNARLSLWQNRNCDIDYDGTRLEYTINGGTIWNTLGIYNDPNAVNWYTNSNIFSSNQPAWDGNSGGWQKSEYICSILNNKPNVQFRFVFTSEYLSYMNDGISIDDFSISLPQPIDAGISLIISPLSWLDAGKTIKVKVKLKNYGSDTLTNIPVSYKINNLININSTWTGILLPNDTITYLFPQTFVMPAGQFNLCVYTGITNDGDHLNDTSDMVLFGNSVKYVPFADDFEGSNFWFSADGNFLWERGIPNSSLINTAHSPVNAWKTNLDGNYPNFCNDNLYTPKLNFSFVLDTAILSFWHWYDCNFGSMDGGVIEYSMNNGLCWTILGSVADTLATNWYNSGPTSLPCWSGTSNGWQKSTYKMLKSKFNNFLSDIQFRFNFFSDNNTNNKNGWAIDDFQINAHKIPFDAGVSSIIQPYAPTIMDSNVPVKIRITNMGTNTINNIPVLYKVNNGTPVSENWTGTLLPDSSTNYTFNTQYVSPPVQYKLRAYTDLSNDSYYYNDTSFMYMFAAPGPIDAGVCRIVTPGTSTPAGSTVTVTAKFINYGTDTLTSMNVSYQINIGTPYTQQWTGILLPGDSTDFVFNTTFIAPISQYNLCSFTTCNGDPNPYNDKYCKNVAINTGTQNLIKEELILYQNIPNPADIYTDIPYSLPSSAKIDFEITDLFGRKIFKKNINQSEGKHTLSLITKDWGSGVYFYSLEFENSKIIRKMIITH